MLAFLKTFMYNTACRHDIGLSPSGKAPDSDSGIQGFESLKPSLSLANMRGLFFSVEIDRTMAISILDICNSRSLYYNIVTVSNKLVYKYNEF